MQTPDPISPVDRIHRHFVSLRRQQHDRRYAGRGGLWGGARSWAAWNVLPILRAARAIARNIGRHPHPLRQLVQVPWLAASYKVHPTFYYQYSLYDHWSRRNDFIYDDENVEVLNDLNARIGPIDAADLSDKRAFLGRCTSAGLPGIPILCEFQDGAVIDHEKDERAFERDLFSKFSNRWCGEGATRWRHDAGRYRSEGTSLSLAELKSHLAQLSREFPIILQPRTFNSPELVDLCGQSLSTVRVVTIRRPGRSPEVAIACFRMASGDNVADNFNHGGIASPVSLDDGTLGPGTYKHAGGTRLIDRHPDSNAAITGRALPRWADVKALAVTAHSVFSTMPSVGWDIAITDHGLILVEGNAVWGVDLPQMTHRRPLGDSAVPGCLAEHLGAVAFT